MADKGTVIVIRHAESMYPADLLSEAGTRHAQEARAKLINLVETVFTSPQTRAVNTANLLVPGSQPTIDIRLRELEIPGISCPTDREYVITAHQQTPALVQQKGVEMLQAIRDLKVRGGTTLIVSHNLAISALNQQLTDEPCPVRNLEGLKLEVNSGGLVQIIARVFFK